LNFNQQSAVPPKGAARGPRPPGPPCYATACWCEYFAYK